MMALTTGVMQKFLCEGCDEVAAQEGTTPSHLPEAIQHGLVCRWRCVPTIVRLEHGSFEPPSPTGIYPQRLRQSKVAAVAAVLSED
jgi:hypothetical protein